MTKKDKLEDNLYNNSETVTSITCSRCRKVKDYPNFDSYEAVDEMIEDGWYATENNVYCPECDSKRKTKK